MSYSYTFAVTGHYRIHHHYRYLPLYTTGIPVVKVSLVHDPTPRTLRLVYESSIMKRLTFTRVFAILAVLHLPYAIQGGSFTIDYEKDTFLKDGEAFR